MLSFLLAVLATFNLAYAESNATYSITVESRSFERQRSDWCFWYDDCREQRYAVQDFCLKIYNELKPNERRCKLTDLRFSSTLTKRAEVDDALHHPEINVLTVEITLGTTNNVQKHEPILGNRRTHKSDISLETFLKSVVEYNALQQPPKAVKLKFRTTEQVKKSEAIVRKYYKKLGSLLMITADIIPGPNSIQTTVNSKTFLEFAKKMPKALVVLGWATMDKGKEEFYNFKHVAQMLLALTKPQIPNPISFSIKAGLVERSAYLIYKLVQGGFSSQSLMIWSPKGSKVDKARLLKLINMVGYNKVFLQLSPDYFRSVDVSRANILNNLGNNDHTDPAEGRFKSVYKLKITDYFEEVIEETKYVNASFAMKKPSHDALDKDLDARFDRIIAKLASEIIETTQPPTSAPSVQ